VPLDGLPESYALEGFPLTAQALDGAAFLVSADDITADPAETSLMAAIGVTELILTGGRDEFGVQWLLEIPADSLTYSMGQFVTTLRCSVAMALRH
jgi:hypothetical protein